MPNPTNPGSELPRRLDLEDAEVSLLAEAFAEPEASELFRALRTGIDWRQEEVVIFGQRRLSATPGGLAWRSRRELHLFRRSA